MVGDFLGVGVTGEADRRGFDLDFRRFGGNVGRSYGEVDVVALGVGGGRALGP